MRRLSWRCTFLTRNLGSFCLNQCHEEAAPVIKSEDGQVYNELVDTLVPKQWYRTWTCRLQGSTVK